MHGTSIIVPAFSNGSITVGVGTKRKKITTKGALPEVWPYGDGEIKEHLRWVGDSSNGFHLVMRDHAESPFFQMEIFTFTALTRRRRSVFTFHKDKLTAVMSESFDDPQFIHKVHGCLAMIQVINESKDCQKCGVMLYPKCRCPLPTEDNTNPLDMQAMCTSMLSHFGSFQGVQEFYICTNSARVASAEMGSRFIVNLEENAEAVKQHFAWAINDRMNQLKPTPKHVLMSKYEKEQLFGYMVENLDDDDEHRLVRKVPQIKNVEDEGDAASEENAGSEDDTCHTTPTLEKNTSNSGQEERRKGKDDLGVSEERVKKMQIRREKNREAARKSNQKKKLLNDQLKAGLKESLSYMEELQVNEAELRVENSKLRRLAAESAQEQQQD